MPCYLPGLVGITVNSLLTDTSIRRAPVAGPGRFSVILL